MSTINDHMNYLHGLGQAYGQYLSEDYLTDITQNPVVKFDLKSGSDKQTKIREMAQLGFASLAAALLSLTVLYNAPGTTIIILSTTVLAHSLTMFTVSKAKEAYENNALLYANN